MSDTISIVMPAHRAEPFIAAAVASVQAQTWSHWQLWIVADDDTNYERLLADSGISDSRFRFLSTGTVGAGAAHARNLALDTTGSRYVAILDADDRFKPGKLARVARALADHPIVSCALDVMDQRHRRLRLVGSGADRVLTPGRHKFVNLSMDSMIAWDRRRTDARYDSALSNMTDLELLLQLWRTAVTSFHLGEPLHDYVKVAGSMSNAAGTSEGMLRSKRILRQRLVDGYYELADAGAATGLVHFLDISLAAEASYPEALALTPGLLFEDHLEPLLAAASTADA